MRVGGIGMSFRLVQSPGSDEPKPPKLIEVKRTPAEGSDFGNTTASTTFFKESGGHSRSGGGNSNRMKEDGSPSPRLSRSSDFSPRTLSKLVHGERNRPQGYHSPLSEVLAQTGSADNGTPPLSEAGMMTPPHLRWAQNLQSLLNDKEGVELFERFLMQEGFGLHDLKFWFACQGLKNYDPGSKNIHQVIKVIYKKYVKTCLVMLNSGTRQDIADKIASRTSMDQSIFDRAQRELEEKTLQHVYLNFLKSDIYLQHVQKNQQDDEEYEASATDDRLAYLGSNFLPTLHEDKELDGSCRNTGYGTSSQFRDNRHLKYSSNRYADALRYSPDSQGQSCYRRLSGNAASHIKYAGYLPASAQDSELQSLSSDAQTDDTLSVTTDGSDCYPTYSSRSQGKKQQRAIKKNASLNKDPMIHHNFIPRTQRVPPERLERLVETHPEQFAAILIEKLGKVKKDLDGYAKLDESLRQIETDDLKVASSSSFALSCGGAETSALERLTQLPPQLLLTGALVQTASEENDQSILDQHVSRVWNDSACQSPLSKTPAGQHSPPSLFRPQAPLPQYPADRRSQFRPLAQPIPPPAPLRGQLLPMEQQYVRPARNQPVFNVNRPRRDRDACSSDSGTVRDFTPESEIPEGFLPPHKHLVFVKEGSGGRRSSGVKKSGTDSSSCVDSGVSVCEPPSSAPNHERVYSWVLDNEKYSYSHGSDSEKDSSTRHRKSSHSSLSTQSSAPTKQSHSKKTGASASHASRSSGSDYPSSRMDSSMGGNVGSGVGSGGVSLPNQLSSNYPQPGQPVAADPFMPILPPPNTTTQLFEAKRRLEDEAAKGKLPKPKMLASSTGKEKYDGPKNSRQSSSAFDDSSRKTGKQRNPSSCNSQGTLNLSNNNNNNTSMATPTAGTLSTSNWTSGGGGGGATQETTVIGYCFTGEAVPYRTKLSGRNITLKQFKSLLSKKGNYRYFFKRSNNEFGTGVVNEEVSDDNEVLPLWEGKIFCTIDPVYE